MSTKAEKEAAAAEAAAAEAEAAEIEAAAQVEKEAAKAAEDSGTGHIDGIEVGDPQLLRPVELPLVVKPAGGGAWANEAQEQFARILNAYAYKNPKKWKIKQSGLLSQLVDLAENPENLHVLAGGLPGVTYTDKRMSA